VSETPANYLILKWGNHDSTEIDAVIIKRLGEWVY
jgi:hypothetical protein